jgi:hypothetical protein
MREDTSPKMNRPSVISVQPRAAAPFVSHDLRTPVAAMLLALAVAAAAHGQAAGAPAPAPAAPAAGLPADPAVPAQELQGLFIDVKGKVQWRAGPDKPWQNAKVNDVIGSGAEVRSGLNSHAALKLGDNATALVDAGTMFQVPTVVREGDTLRTVVAVKSGRADFKVDKVGLSNDFKVVTPSTTLAVRGTGFAVATGALKQVEVLGARRNAINAIQLKYALTNTTVQMSGGAASSSSVQQPTHNALVSTAPPTTAGALPSTSVTEAVVQAAVGQSPANPGSSAANQQGNTATTKSQNSVAAVTDPVADGNGIVAQINRALIQRGADAVADADGALLEARAEVDQSIELLLADLGEEELLDANRHALEALKLLAEKRRDAALGALSRHGQAQVDAGAAEADASARAEAFDSKEAQLLGRAGDGGQSPPTVGHVGRFDAGRDAAAGSLAGIRGLLDGAVAGGSADADALIALVGDANDHLDSMGHWLTEGKAALIDMADELLAVEAIVSDLEEGARQRALDAIEDYELALGHLERAVEAGDDAERIAGAARATVAALKDIVDVLAASRPAAQLVSSAASAAALLSAATEDLDRAIRVRDAVRGARDTAANDPRRPQFGAVEQAFTRIVELRTALLGRWTTADGEVSARDGQFASTLVEADSTIGSVSGAAVQRIAAVSSQADGASSDASAALATHATARLGAESARDAADDRFEAFRDRLDSFDAGHQDSSEALDGIAAMVAAADAASGAELGQAASLGAAALAQVHAARAALESMDAALAEAQSERAAVGALLAGLDAGQVVSAQQAIAAYGEAMSQLDVLVARGADAGRVAEAALGAAQRLEDLVGSLDGVLPPDALQPLAQAAAARRAAADASLSAVSEARAAIDALVSSAGTAGSAAGFGDVAAIRAAIDQALAGSAGGAQSSASALAASIVRTQSEYDALAAIGTRYAGWLRDAAAAREAAAGSALVDAQAGRQAAGAASADAALFRDRAIERQASAEGHAAAGTAARAQLDVQASSVTQALGGLDALQSHSFTFPSGVYGTRQFSTVTSGPLPGNIVGFTITFGFEAIANGTWASDAALAINGRQWGGYDGYTFPGVDVLVDGNWSFFGGGSAATGTYSETVGGLSIPTSSGVTILFGNAWNVGVGTATARYEDISLVLRTMGSPGYSPALAASRTESMASAASSLESMRASLDSLAIHHDALRDLADRAAWNAESAQLQSRADAARTSVQAALAAAAAAASGAGVAVGDLQALAATMTAFAEAASQLEERFGARGFAADAVEGAAGGVPTRLSEAVLARDAAESLHALVAQLDQDAEADGRVLAALEQAAAALDASDASVSALFATAQSQLSAGSAAFAERAGTAASRFADYGLSARTAAGDARADAQSTAAVADPLAAMVALRSDASARDQQVTAAVAAFGAYRDEFLDARASASSGLAALPAAAAGTSGMSEAAAVAAALERMEVALIGALGTEAQSMQGQAMRTADVLADTARYQALTALASQATAAIDDLLAAVSPTASRAADAASAAAAAQAASDAAQRIVTISADLEARFGLSGAAIRASAQSAAQASAQAATDRSAAEQARDRVADLAAGYRNAQDIEALRQQIVAALASTDAGNAGTGAAQADALAEAQGQRIASNRQGAITFGALTGSRRDQAAELEAGGLAAAAHGRVGALVAGLDQAAGALDAIEADAGDALGRATTARGASEGARALAESHRDDAQAFLGLTQDRLAVDDLPSAQHSRDGARTSADASAFQSGRADAFRADAVAARDEIVMDLDPSMGNVIASFTSSSPSFQSAQALAAAIAAERPVIDGEAALASTLEAQAAYFDAVAQVLAGRAGGGLSAELQGSAAALSEVQRISAELASLSTGAAGMASHASTNAGRVFGRSLSTYVAGAQQQVSLATAAANAAAAAAAQANGFANDAAAAVQQHGAGSGPGGPAN